MTVAKICEREVVFADESLSVAEAARLMRCYSVSELAVLEKRAGRNRLMGIITNGDIVGKVMSTGVAPDVLTVGDIVAQDQATVAESASVYEAICLMHAEGVQRMPVVDGSGGLVGILTLGDLLGLLAEEMTELSKLESNERQHDATTRN